MIMKRRRIAFFMAGVIICSGGLLSAFTLPSEARTAVHWAEPVLQWMVQSKIMLGDGKGNLMPDRPVTESELMIMLAKLKQAKLPEKNQYSNQPLTRGKMVERLSEVLQIDASQLLSGYGDGTLKQERMLSRAEMAVVLKKAMGDRIVTSQTIKDKTYSGNLLIATGGVRLEGVTIKNNLYLAEGIKDQEAFLKNVTVLGKVIVEGGGANSIYIENAKLNELVLNKIGTPVNVVLSGNTSIKQLAVRTPVTLKIGDQVKMEGVQIDSKIESLQINNQAVAINKTMTQLQVGKLQFPLTRTENFGVNTNNPVTQPKATAANTGLANGKNGGVDTVTHATQKVPSSTGNGSSNSGGSGHGSNGGGNEKPEKPSTGVNTGTGGGTSGNQPEPGKPSGQQSAVLDLNKVKWLEVEGTHYLVLVLKQGHLEDYEVHLDGQVATVLPVDQERTIGKIEGTVLPKNLVVKATATGISESIDLKKIFAPEVTKPEPILSIQTTDLTWQNTLQERSDNMGFIEGLIKIVLPNESKGYFELDAVSGATVKGSTPEVYVGNLPQGITAKVSVDEGNPKTVNIALKGQALQHGSTENRAIMIKLLGKAIKGTTVQFTQVDQVQALTFDKFADGGIKPVEPSKPTGLHIIKSEQVTIEGVPYYVVVLAAPKKPEEMLTYKGVAKPFKPVNAEGTVWKYEIGVEE